jgi:importin subunit alpha-1
VYVDILWGLSYLSDGDDDQIESVIRPGVVSRLVGLLTSKVDTAMTMPICRILGNFASGNERQTQQVLDAGVPGLLSSLLRNGTRQVRKEVCWMASNIAAGSENQISALVDTPFVLAHLVDRALNGQWAEQKEALWAISNVCTSGSAEHVRKVIHVGGIQPLVMVLRIENAECNLLTTVLQAIERIIVVGEECGLDAVQLVHEYDGITIIENLQNHPSSVVYEAAVRVIETHFGEDEDDENLAPENNGTTFGFGLSSPKQLFPTDCLNSSESTSTQHQTFDFGIRQGYNNYASM